MINFANIDKNITTISFDIFDTLVHRRVKAPVDVFELVRLKIFEDPISLRYHDHFDNFTYLRIAAERSARLKISATLGGEPEVTFNEIYEELEIITGLPKEIIQFLQKTELQTEDLVLYSSPEGMKLYNDARASGKRILFISDMYLPSTFLCEMLLNKGYQNADQNPLFVSAECRLSKHTGSLYEHVAKELEIKNRTQWMHVGDNVHADIHNAKQASITPLYADWSKVQNIHESRTGELKAPTIESILDFLNQSHAKHFIPDDPLERIGYIAYGPALFGFTIWLLDMVKEKKFDHLIFFARDGLEVAREICTRRISGISA